LKENNVVSVLAREFYRNSSEYLHEELIRIGAFIRLFLEKTRAEVVKIDRTLETCSFRKLKQIRLYRMYASALKIMDHRV